MHPAPVERSGWQSRDKSLKGLLFITDAPFSVAFLGAVFTVGTAVVCKHFSPRRAGVRENLCTDTFTAVLIPPVLSGMVGAEQPWTSLWGIGKFASAVLAARLT